MVEDLRQVKDLTSATAITKSQGQEAAKRRAEMARSTPKSSSAIQKVCQGEDLPTTSQTCPGCGANLHQGGRRQCPAFNQTCHLCQKIGHFAKVCRGRQAQQHTLKPTPQPHWMVLLFVFQDTSVNVCTGMAVGMWLLLESHQDTVRLQKLQQIPHNHFPPLGFALNSKCQCFAKDRWLKATYVEIGFM